ncbi:hypothetical protein K1719_012822 [Acacia pycnantha]|nr:hypothetical protein K1719_012822 [Acacia pycnantha]
MCVELDLNKPLVPEFNVEGQLLSVVYESLGQLCNKCGRVRHMKDGCEAFHRKMNEDGMVVDEGAQTKKYEGAKEGDKNLWQTVQSNTVVPESNLMVYEWQGVHSRDKENLHPGEGNGTASKQEVPGSKGLYTDGADMVAAEDSSMRMEEVCPIAVLAD